MTHDHVELTGVSAGLWWPGVALALTVVAVGFSARASARAEGRALRAAHLVMALAMLPMLLRLMLPAGVAAGGLVVVAGLVVGAGLVARPARAAGIRDLCGCLVDLLGMAAVLLASTQGVPLTVVVAGGWVAASVVVHAVTLRVSGAVGAVAAATAMAVMAIPT